KYGMLATSVKIRIDGSNGSMASWIWLVWSRPTEKEPALTPVVDTPTPPSRKLVLGIIGEERRMYIRLGFGLSIGCNVESGPGTIESDQPGGGYAGERIPASEPFANAGGPTLPETLVYWLVVVSPVKVIQLTTGIGRSMVSLTFT